MEKLTPEKTVEVLASKPVGLAVVTLRDHPECYHWEAAKHEVENGKITLFVRETTLCRYHTMDYRPGFLSVRFLLHNLKQGTYEVFLDKTFVGKVRVAPDDE